MGVLQVIRTGIVVPLLVLDVGSCSLSVELAVVNGTASPVFVGSGPVLARINAGKGIILRDWPQDNLLTVKTNECVRIFDLTENYSPANEWRSAGSKNVRRFEV